MKHATMGEVDPNIVEQARRGDTNAFAQIVRHYQAPVYNLAFRMLGDAPEAEDAAQETFLRAYSRLGSYQPENKFATWLLSISAHYCIDRLRRRRFRWLPLDEGSLLETLAAGDPGPEETAFAHERAEEVQALLQKLSPGFRAVVVLKYWHDLDVNAIAQITGDSAGSVKVKLFRARQLLAREMKQRMRREESMPRRLGGAVSHAR